MNGYDFRKRMEQRYILEGGKKYSSTSAYEFGKKIWNIVAKYRGFLFSQGLPNAEIDELICKVQEKVLKASIEKVGEIESIEDIERME